MKRRNKNRNTRPVFIEQLEPRQMLSADLAPYTAEWGTAMVFSNKKSTFHVTQPDKTSFLPTDTIYIAAGFVNVGDPVPGTFQIDMGIYVNDVLVDSDFFDFDNNDPLGSNASFARINFSAGKLGVGTYTIKFAYDINDAVAESNEANNTVTRQITVTGAPASKVSFVGGVKPAVAGQTIAPVKVKVTNNSNQPIFNESVDLAIFSGPNGGTLLGTVTGVTGSDGTITFNDLKLETAGSYKLVATDGVLTSPASSSFKISPAALDSVDFIQEPTNVNAGAKFNPVITVKASDVFGNGIKGKPIKLAVNAGPNGAKITGTISATTNASGIATFKTTALKTAGNYKFIASNQVGANPPTTDISAQFTVAPGFVSKLVFTTLPVGAVNNQNTTVVVTGVDLYGNTATSLNSGLITLFLLSKPSGGQLTGTTGQTPTAGVATYADIKFTIAGRYSLKAQMGAKTFNSAKFLVT